MKSIDDISLLCKKVSHTTCRLHVIKIENAEFKPDN